MTIRAIAAYKEEFKRHQLMYFLGALSVGLTVFAETIVPKFVQWTLDLISTKNLTMIPQMFVRQGLKETLDFLALSFILILVLTWGGRWAWRQTLARRTHEAGRDLKVQIWQHLRFWPLRSFHKFPLGDLMNRATGDLNATRFIMGFTLVLTFDMVFFAALALTFMMLIDFELALASIVLLPFLPRPLIKLAKKEFRLHQLAQETLSKLSDLIAQCLTTIRMQRATSSEKIWQKRLDSDAKVFSERRFEVLKTGWKIYPLANFPTLFAYGILLTWGIIKVRNGELSIGEFVAFQSYIMMLQTPLSDLANCISEWQTGLASFNRIVEVYDHKYEKVSFNNALVKPNASTALAIAINGLSYRYDEAEPRLVLDNVTLAINKGETIGITGPIGAGKSTLLNILTGLVDVEVNKVFVFGNDLTLCKREFFQSQVTMVPQRSFLFSGTVRANLELDQQYSDQDLWQVLKIVELYDEIEQWPKRLDATIGEWGVNLSGGQKQRLALARALLKSKSIYLFDDCLTAVDSITEERILKNLKEFFPNCTVIWVAHRLSTLKNCDKIFELNQGRLRQLP